MTLLVHLGVNLVIVALAHLWTSDVMVVAPADTGALGLVLVTVLSAVLFALANVMSLRVQLLMPGFFALLVNIGLLLAAAWLARHTGFGLLAVDRVAVAWAAILHAAAHLAVSLLSEAGYFARPKRRPVPAPVRYREH